jgi:IclR family acetate operon transcriptional repressor
MTTRRALTGPEAVVEAGAEANVQAQQASGSSDHANSTTIQSVRRAARLLLAAAREDGITARQAAERFSLSLPTSYHLLNSLASEGLLAKQTYGLYAIGPRASIIADAVDRDMRPRPEHLSSLRELAVRTDETAYLSAWRSGEVRIISMIESPQVVRAAALEVGYAKNLHARTSARVLLAFADPLFRANQIDRLKFRRLTPTTITTRTEFDRDLARIRSTGVAIGRDEYVPGLTCASVPIADADAVAAAFTIAVPSDRFNAAEPELIDALNSAASRAGRS